MIDVKSIKKTYSNKDMLPEAAKLNLNEKILDRFREEKEVFWGDIKPYFPGIYEYLMNSTSELYLVDADDEGELFYWCLGCKDKYIFSSISKTPRDIKVRISERDYYNALPSFLKPFYYCFNGFDITKEPNLHLHETGFLLSFPNWYDFSVISEYHKNTEGFEVFSNDFSSLDLRVIARNIDDEVILIDMSSNNGTLWRAKWGNIADIHIILNPIDYITEYFLKAVSS